MDGNGRWAKERGKPRDFGHRAGVKALKRVIDIADKSGIPLVSFYAFSTENWKRPKEERDKLFSYIKRFADNEMPKYARKNIRARFMGDLKGLPEDVYNSIIKIIDFTKDNSGMTVNIALNYGGRSEIIQAVNNIIGDKIERVDEDIFNRYLYSDELPDPDIIVRTSGEKRLSNFMLYQSAYSELIFIDEYWPDFDKDTFDKVIGEYNKRLRKYGDIKE